MTLYDWHDCKKGIMTKLVDIAKIRIRVTLLSGHDFNEKFLKLVVEDFWVYPEVKFDNFCLYDGLTIACSDRKIWFKKGQVYNLYINMTINVI